MIKITANRVYATDNEGNVLFTMSTEDSLACHFEIKNSEKMMSEENRDEVVAAVRTGVQMLGMSN
jgi:hypothetical protein